MKRLLVVALVALASCASRQQTSSSAIAPAEAQPAIEPASLSPEQIRLVQRSLIDRGFAVDLTGTFDQPTQDALSQFQRARGLKASGKLNTPTLEALGLDPRDVMPVRGPAPTMTEGAEDSNAPSAGHGSAAAPDSTPSGSTSGARAPADNDSTAPASR